MLFMKKICLIILLQIAVFTVFAQKNQPVNVTKPEAVNPISDKQEYQGYTIRLIPAMPAPGSLAGYGFDILINNKPVVHQFQNALPFSQKGIQKKDDAYKIAQWIIQNFKKTGHWQNTVSADVARSLKIETL
jgi:hypothetical protein